MSSRLCLAIKNRMDTSPCGQVLIFNFFEAIVGVGRPLPAPALQITRLANRLYIKRVTIISMFVLGSRRAAINTCVFSKRKIGEHATFDCCAHVQMCLMLEYAVILGIRSAPVWITLCARSNPATCPLAGGGAPIVGGAVKAHAGVTGCWRPNMSARSSWRVTVTLGCASISNAQRGDTGRTSCIHWLTICGLTPHKRATSALEPIWVTASLMGDMCES